MVVNHPSNKCGSGHWSYSHSKNRIRETGHVMVIAVIVGRVILVAIVVAGVMVIVSVSHVYNNHSSQ